MIQIQIKAGHRHIAIDVSGHANAAPKGEDVICAGVSALVLTLAEALPRAGAPDYTCSLADGKACIECRRTDATEPVFNTVVCGLDLLAKTYPQYIKVSI